LKPWQHLERLCCGQGLDDFAVKDILFEHLGRTMACECQVLFLIRLNFGRMPLTRQFGIDFHSGEFGFLNWDGTAEPFSGTMRNGIWNFGVRWRVAWIFGLEKKNWVMDEGPGICSLTNGFEHHKCKD
jgi:hypothetical protein